MATDGDSAQPPAGAVRQLKRPAPLRESVYEALTEMIIAGTLKPGEHLVEVALAEMLGVSRQPVREALQRLHNEGWVNLRPGYGATVQVPSEDEVDQLLAARTVLETESARLAATRATKEDVEKLEALCKEGSDMIATGDVDGAVKVNAELHRVVAELSGNRYLADFSAQVDRRVRWYYTPVAPQRGQASWREHAQLIKAIAAGDGDKAADVMHKHTDRTRRIYHEGLKTQRSSS